MSKISRRQFLKIAALTASFPLISYIPGSKTSIQKNALSVDDPSPLAGQNYSVFIPSVKAPGEIGSWPMVGANPARTSWTTEEIRGDLTPVWARSIESYINYKIQIIAALGKLFISSSRGLYALNADTGNVDWVYPTELPLGNSPTVDNGVVYVGGYDKRIHAINGLTGKLIPTWTFYEAGAGFETNPIVLNNTVYAGNRDGYFYALDSITGTLKWKYKTGGPILFSPAYKNGVLYFASNDSYAYAIKAISDDPQNKNGQLVWKSVKFPGAGFHSYWAVIYTNKATQKDYVVFSGSMNFQNHDDYFNLDIIDLYPNRMSEPAGTLIGSSGKDSYIWASGTNTINVSRITKMFQDKPYRRVVFMLDAQNGQEFTFDSNGDGKPEYLPYSWAGTTHSGNKYPPIVGSDGVLYQFANFSEAPWIPRGQVSGWKFGTSVISRAANRYSAVDEPMAFSGGGKLIYWNLCCDRGAGAFDITIPFDQPNRSWQYFDYGLPNLLPNYQPSYYGNDFNGWGLFGGINGIYGKHGNQHPPIPYRGKLFMQNGNTIYALGKNGPVSRLPIAATVSVAKAKNPVSLTDLQQKLETEIQKIVSDPATFLRPGYHGTSFFNQGHSVDGDHLIDYFHNPSDTLYTLIQALPYISTTLQNQTKVYLQQFFNRFPPYNIVSVGWKDGLAREVFDIPPDVAADYLSGPLTSPDLGTWWQNFPPDLFYGASKYAQVFGGALSLFNNMKNKLETPPNDSYLLLKPYIHNAYISGYQGYLDLQNLAGLSETAAIRTTLNHLLDLRATQFTKDSPYVLQDTTEGYTSIDYNRALNISRNFMFIVPELGDYLHDHALSKVQTAIDEYNRAAPCWFVSKYDAFTGEGTLQHLFDYQAIFQAKAYILRESREELGKFLDVPAFDRGDLFYIQNLVATIKAPTSLP